MKLSNVRREYKFAELNESTIDGDPLALFSGWLEEALRAGIDDPTAMSLVTVGTDGFPGSRIVLLKDFGTAGFTFFTSYESHKARAIANDQRVGLHFYWPGLERQVRISGMATKTDAATSEKYFRSRPRPSRIAAVISKQSTEIPSRKFLEQQFDALEERLRGQDPERPENWGGYTVVPVRFEFWQGRENRLHDRIVYEKSGESWEIKRLAP